MYKRDPRKKSKSDATYYGPYEITDLDKRGNVTVIEAIVDGKPVKSPMPIDHLKLAVVDTKAKEEIYEVKEILDVAFNDDGSKDYQVSWKNYDDSFNHKVFS